MVAGVGTTVRSDDAERAHWLVRWAMAVFVGLFGGFAAGMASLFVVLVITDEFSYAAIAAIPAAVAAGVGAGWMIVKRMRGLGSVPQLTAVEPGLERAGIAAGDRGAVPASGSTGAGGGTSEVVTNPYAPPTLPGTAPGPSQPWPDEGVIASFTFGKGRPRRVVFTDDAFYAGGDGEPVALAYGRDAFVRAWSVRIYTRDTLVIGLIGTRRVAPLVLPAEPRAALVRWLGPRFRELLPASLQTFWLVGLIVGAIYAFQAFLATANAERVAAVAGAVLLASSLLGRLWATAWAWLPQAAGWAGIALGNGMALASGKWGVWHIPGLVFAPIFALQMVGLFRCFRRYGR
jgi:hypothetical protein